jgi:hypothetical protein
MAKSVQNMIICGSLGKRLWNSYEQMPENLIFRASKGAQLAALKHTEAI